MTIKTTILSPRSKYIILLMYFFAIFMSTGCDIGSSVNPCPATSACGCSGHNKSSCEFDSCCKWTVGQGCDCS